MNKHILLPDDEDLFDLTERAQLNFKGAKNTTTPFLQPVTQSSVDLLHHLKCSESSDLLVEVNDFETQISDTFP